MISRITPEIREHTIQLSDAQQLKVLEFVHSLTEERIVGVEGSTLMRFAGLFPLDELERMEQAIAEGCGRTTS